MENLVERFKNLSIEQQLRNLYSLDNKFRSKKFI